MKLKVSFLDVYHGDCAVITFEEADGKACIVVDGGETVKAAKRLAAYLKHEGVEIIDLMVATHIDSDHVRGLLHLLKKESGNTSSWNKGKTKCIRYYWGPLPDPDYGVMSPSMTIAETSRRSTGLNMFDYVIKSVNENQELHDLVKEHIVHTDNIYYPSLENPPLLDLFNGVTLTLLAPDSQIYDTEIKKKALYISNLPYKEKVAAEEMKIPKKRLSLKDLKRILAMNAEEMATIANRTANNQSIVFKLSPKTDDPLRAPKWTFLFTGDAEHESWEMMKERVDIKEKLPARVLKVPHHGSINGIDRESFMIIKPWYSVVSVGNKHGLPDGETLNLIRANKNRLMFCTEQNLSTSKPGPCVNQQNCVRKNKSDFRSIFFEIDTDTGDEKIKGFKIETSPGSYSLKTANVWCPERTWPKT
jgi:beta-lactamase superfamily II metal-dependent hydrolase